MSAVVVFGILWVAAGILVGLRWWTDRDAAGRAQSLTGPANTRFGQPSGDGSLRRRLAMRRAYLVGAGLVVAGLVTQVPVVLALGAAMVNLGTMYRYLVVALDLDGLDTPLLIRAPEAAHLAPRRALARLAE